MTLHFRLTAWLFLVFGSTLAAQTDGQPQWHLPDVLGSAPALFVTEAPEGYTLAESQACVAQVVTYDLFCDLLTWDDLCQEAYDCCTVEDDILNLGCTNVNACNYDPTVCVDLPTSCVFCLDHCFTLQMMDAEGNGWEGVTWHLSNNHGQTLDSGTLQNGYNALASGCLEDGCYTLEVEEASEDNLLQWVLETSQGDPVVGGAGGSATFAFNGFEGCTIPWACNYDEEACVNDGSCVFATSEVTEMMATMWDLNLDSSCDSTASASVLTFEDDFTASSNLDSMDYSWSLCNTTLTLVEGGQLFTGVWNGLGFEGGSAEDGGCFTLYPVGLGCTDELACNYDVDALHLDDSCTYPGCMNPLSCNYDPLAGCPAPCDLPAGYTEGCTNPLSNNYDASATVEDGSCDLSYMCLNGTIYDEQLMGCVPVCPGDMNFDGAINVNDLLEFLLVYDTLCP